VHKDALSSFLRSHWVFATRASESQDHARVRYFEEQRLVWLINLCSTAVAAVLLIGPILALYFITDPDARLGLVIAFIVLFAAALAVSTGASRDSIFGATAAYTAVLVVFVSGDLGNAKAKGRA
jgi:MFS superfamily sulfate permease-like transporter